MDRIKKNFGFGCMRFPMNGDKVDTEQVKSMVDEFLDAGFNYFDTAHGYHSGMSETTLRECLTSRYPRDKYILTNKLSFPFFNTTEEIRPLFESQLKACGVDYFDFYLMHAQSKTRFESLKKIRAYETALELKAEGKFRHFGISFHDSADVLDMILNEYPQIEVVQIQYNYLDLEDPAIESRKCLEVCRKHGKPVIVMEPVKGGYLANLPEKAQSVVDRLARGSAASYAIRFAAGADGVFMVLSGMSDLAQLRDNIEYMRDFKPLDENETNAISEIRDVFREMQFIPCTACRYCTDGCPQSISIPDLFATINAKKMHDYWNADEYYKLHTAKHGRASDCIECGACEEICPQHLEIRSLLKTVSEEFEK